MIVHSILVIGGGASGLVAAITAKDYGGDVAIIEGGNRMAKKILTTGNGRCNFSNRMISSPYKNFHSQNEGFYQSVLDQLTVDKTLDLFYTYGLNVVELEKGKLYPQSLQASSLVDLLKLNVEERAIPVYLETKVSAIQKTKSGFIIETQHPEHPKMMCQKLLIATGGLASPSTGSDGSMLGILKALGHSIIRPLPSIVQLKCDAPYLKAISGVRFDALASVYVNKEFKRSDFDEILFTDYGISGPAILQISREASIGLSNKQAVTIVVDLFKDQSLKELTEFFEGHFAIFSHRSIYQSLIGLIHKKLIPVLLKMSGIEDIHQLCDELNYKQKQAFYKNLKSWAFTCIDTNGFQNAQTTIGGVDTQEINHETLESKLFKGLFFSGEVIDVDGDCGGFNLQWAWSSGFVSGNNIIK